MTEMTTVHALSSEYLQELLQSMGYRVTLSEHNGQLQLQSAAQGMGFAVRPGNPSQASGEFVDCTWSCALRVQGELPAELVSSWNISKRFARLSRQGEFLVLEADMVVAGGVSRNHLQALVELWDRLLQELLFFLRSYAQSYAQAQTLAATDNAAGEGAGKPEPANEAGAAKSARPNHAGAAQ